MMLNKQAFGLLIITGLLVVCLSFYAPNSLALTSSNDTKAPQVKILQPYDGEKVSGIKIIKISAIDESSSELVIEIGFTYGSITTQDPTPEPAMWIKVTNEYKWDTSQYSNDYYTIHARAKDTAGNIGYANPITVMITSITDLNQLSGETQYNNQFLSGQKIYWYKMSVTVRQEARFEIKWSSNEQVDLNIYVCTEKSLTKCITKAMRPDTASEELTATFPYTGIVYVAIDRPTALTVLPIFLWVTTVRNTYDYAVIVATSEKSGDLDAANWLYYLMNVQKYTETQILLLAPSLSYTVEIGIPPDGTVAGSLYEFPDGEPSEITIEAQSPTAVNIENSLHWLYNHARIDTASFIFCGQGVEDPSGDISDVQYCGIDYDETTGTGAITDDDLAGAIDQIASKRNTQVFLFLDSDFSEGITDELETKTNRNKIYAIGGSSDIPYPWGSYGESIRQYIYLTRPIHGGMYAYYESDYPVFNSAFISACLYEAVPYTGLVFDCDAFVSLESLFDESKLMTSIFGEDSDYFWEFDTLPDISSFFCNPRTGM